jgi:apolipoprotein D and lipocalin family protein
MHARALLAAPTGAAAYSGRMSPPSPLRAARTLLPALLAGAAPLLAAPGATGPGPVDLQRFAGAWYELARLPSSDFQSACNSDIVDRYTLRKDGSFDLVSSCLTPTGKPQTETGRAWPVPARGGLTLRVSYMPAWLQWLPVKRGELSVVMLEPHYQYAVLGDRDGQRLTLLSRTPALPPEQLSRIVDRLAAQGYPARQLVLTHQHPLLRDTDFDRAARPFTGRPRLIVRRDPVSSCAAPPAA